MAMIPDSKLNSNSKHVLEPKENIRKDNQGRSPDIADAMVLTFAEPVMDESQEEHHIWNDPQRAYPPSELATRRRIVDNNRGEDYQPRGRFS